jgi:V8-like Glu-specific endopeptidase
MRGTVTKVEWTNPHARVYIDVQDDTGQVANWNFEMASPNILVRNGWKQNTVKVGDQIKVSGYLARKGGRMAIAGAVADANGKPIFDSNPDITR